MLYFSKQHLELEMFKIDSHYLIGSNHIVCEDYAYHTTLKFNEEDIPVILVADGCSSSPDTDIGSRILTHAAISSIKWYFERRQIPLYQDLGQMAINRARSSVDTIGLNSSCLDSTLMIAFVIGENIYGYVYGDGSTVVNGSAYTYEYSGNAPYYLNYWNDTERNRLYFNTPQDVTILETSEDIDPQEIRMILDTLYIDSFALVSDGVGSFLDLNGSIDQEEIVDEIAAIKNSTGEFVKRRLNRLVKTYKKNGKEHYDDISVAMLLKDKSNEWN